MTAPDDGGVVIGGRVDNMRGPAIEGSVIQPCSSCDSPLWITPYSREKLTEPGIVLMCMGCADGKLKALRDDGEPASFAFSPGWHDLLVKAGAPEPLVSALEHVERELAKNPDSVIAYALLKQIAGLSGY
jgi:hypothetical protein